MRPSRSMSCLPAARVSVVGALLMASCVLGISVSCRKGAKTGDEAAVLPSPEAQAARTPEAPPRPGPEALARILDQAPHLNRESAELLLSDAERRRVPPGDFGEDGLILATAGFSRLPEEQVREVGGLFNQVYAPMTQAARIVVEAYLHRVRRGDAAMTEPDRQGRELLRAGISRLPDTSRQRLQALFAVAIREALAARRQVAEASLLPPPPAAPEPWGRAHYRMSEPQEGSGARPSPSPTPADEEEWRVRQKAEAYKAQLAGLEAAVKAAERELESARKSYDDARQIRMTPHLDDPGSRARDEAQRRIEAAEESLRKARNALADFEREVRREGIPPGYLR